MIQHFARTHQLTLEVDTKVLGKSGSRIPGKGGYVFELTDEPETLYAVLKTTSSAEKWGLRIRPDRPIVLEIIFPPLKLPNWIALAALTDTSFLVSSASHLFLPAS